MSCLAQTTKSGESVAANSGKLEKMPEALETRFALSAIPSHLREAATTYVLDPAKGYVLSHKGTNGIGYRRAKRLAVRQLVRDDIFGLSVMTPKDQGLSCRTIYAAELRARGITRQAHAEVAKIETDYLNPSRPDSCLLPSCVAILGTTATMNMPHYMFYRPTSKRGDQNALGLTHSFGISGRDDICVLLVGETESENTPRKTLCNSARIVIIVYDG
jgi:hypothetical protein